ncbi:hypothetical protein [Sulfurovum mangrovi]|uniref:hypothetical protein n=1 Tax=Sulfurovum mangrovi TaxID=2893889 RepID=UPI001E581E5F|nr:hypothetical protein [Sulfurovum mangrovi]UFH58130.1 hypothetical protein LN246_07175 [Sulfurovum mangrovi]
MKYLFTLLIFISSLVAELPPQVYDKMKAISPEILKVLVLHVNKHGENVDAYAKVIKVQRSVSEFKAGDEISIRYIIPNRLIGWVGPSSAVLLHKDEEYTAFLKCVHRECSLAAKGKSFSKSPYQGQIKDVPQTEF